MRVWILTAVIALLSYGSLAWGQTLPSVDDFFEYEDMSAPAMSPNGDQVCVVDSRDLEAQRVLIIDLNNLNAPSALPFGDKKLNWCSWATDNRVIVSVSVERKIDFGRYSAPRNAENIGYDFALLMAVDKDGENSKLISGNTGSKALDLSVNLTRMVSKLLDDPEHVLMLAYDNDFNLYRVNIFTGTWTVVEKGNRFTSGYKVNRQGVPIVRFDRVSRGKNVKILTRAIGEKRWTKLTTVRREDLEKFSPIAETDSPGIMYVSATPEGYDRASIFKYDLKKKEFLEAVSTHPKVDLYRVLTTPQGDYAGTVYYDDRLTYDFLDDSLQAYLKGTDAFFEGEMDMSIRSVSNDGKRWIIFADSPRHPGSYYSFDLDKRRIEKIYDTLTALRPDQLGKTDWIEYSTRDGVTLNAYLTHPARGGAHSSAPLIVMPHGGPESRDYYGYDEMVQYLASRGYRIFQPLFRGSEGYGKAFAESGYGEWGGRMQDDVTDGVQHLIDSGKAQSGKICIAGASYGGYAALMGAIKTPELYQCAVSIAGVTDLPEFLKSEAKENGKTSEVYRYWVKSLGKTRNDKENLKKNSPVLNASKIDIPILSIQGGRDGIVLPEQGRRLNAAMTTAGKDIRYVEYENMNHYLRGMTDEMRESEEESDDDNYVYYKKTLQEMEAFFAQHLK